MNVTGAHLTVRELAVLLTTLDLMGKPATAAQVEQAFSKYIQAAQASAGASSGGEAPDLAISVSGLA